jgi:hypothetical protein
LQSQRVANSNMQGIEARSPLHRFAFVMCCLPVTSLLVYAPMRTAFDMAGAGNRSSGLRGAPWRLLVGCWCSVERDPPEAVAALRSLRDRLWNRLQPGDLQNSIGVMYSEDRHASWSKASAAEPCSRGALQDIGAQLSKLII